MKNYGIFTHICALHGFNVKEPKLVRKAAKIAKEKNVEC